VILAQTYLARYKTPFAAYMALQRALMLRYLSAGGTEQLWCQRIAPVFAKRYELNSWTSFADEHLPHTHGPLRNDSFS
jgi:hypothetical protein